MMQFMNFLKSFYFDEKGHTMSEYVLIMILIAVVAIIAATVMGAQINGSLTTAADSF